jgi:hypothetical protein
MSSRSSLIEKRSRGQTEVHVVVPSDRAADYPVEACRGNRPVPRVLAAGCLPVESLLVG